MYSSKRTRSYREKKEVTGRRIRRVVLVLFLFALFQFFTIYISTPLKINSRSMEPALSPSDRILFSRVSLEAQTMFDQFSFWGLERGDLVVMHPPYYRENLGVIDLINPVIRFFTFQKIQFSSYNRPHWEDGYIVKRIIGLPGDSVRVENYKVYITPAGSSKEVLEETLAKTEYSLLMPRLPGGWKEGYPFDGHMDTVVLGEDELFLLSDSRGKGNDSLYWGPVKETNILGKVLFRYFPFNKMSLL